MTLGAHCVGTLHWWPPGAKVPGDWTRCQGQPVVEFPGLEPVIQVMGPPLLAALDFVDTPAGWRLPEMPDYIIRVRR